MRSFASLLTVSTVTAACMRQASVSTLVRIQQGQAHVLRSFGTVAATGRRSTAPAYLSLRGGGYRSKTGNRRNNKKIPCLSSVVGLGLTACGIASSSSALHAHAEASEGVVKNEFLYPPITAFKEDYIKVDDRHTLYYHCYGNPHGKPVLFIHGGPGGGTDPANARYFDPKVYRVVLVDQRGCGKSTPFADLTDNTTWDSVNDFEKIRKKLGIEKWQVFGGSWGSTLALSYAISHPSVVTELVLRGIFMLRDKELKWFYQGPGAGYVFPQEWEAYEAAIPESERNDLIAAYGKRLRGELGKEEMMKAAKAWSIWEGRTSKLVQDDWEIVKKRFGADDFSLAFARIENHYFTNKGFFPRDGWLIEKENIDKIRHIPTVIVQGRYDMVCPAVSAFDLKKAFPEATLHVTITGHSSLEPAIIEKLVQATDEFSSRK